MTLKLFGTEGIEFPDESFQETAPLPDAISPATQAALDAIQIEIGNIGATLTAINGA